MVKLFLKIYDSLSSRRTAVGIAVLILTLLCCLSASRMRYDEDISAFLPFNEETSKYSEVFASFGGNNRIAVIFNNADQTASRPLTEAMDAFSGSLAMRDRENVIQESLGHDNETAILEAIQAIWQNYPALLDGEDYAILDTLSFTDSFLRGEMDKNKMSLLLPSGGVVSASLPYDPLHISSGIMDRLRSLNINGSYKMSDGHLFIGNSGIIMLESPFGISESRDNEKIQVLLDSTITEIKAVYPDISISAVGAPLIAVTNAQRIKSDSFIALGIAVILILVILLYSLRKVKYLVWIGISVLFGWIFALGAMAVIRESISLIVIGIGSIIIGIAVNYPLHFIDHLKHEQDVREVLREMVSPLLVGNITTVSAFLCLVLLDARAMQDLGLFGAFTLIGTILFVLLFLPVLLRAAKPTGSDRKLIFGKLEMPQNRRVRRAVLWCVIILTALFGYFSTGTSFDSDMQNINYMTPEQREGLKLLSSDISGSGGTDAILYAVAEGKTLDAALQKNEVMVETMSGIGGISNIAGIAGIVPSDSLYRVNTARWKEFWSGKKGFWQKLDAAAAEAGFAPDAFSPFKTLLTEGSPGWSDITENPLYSLVGKNFVMQTADGYRIVNFVHAERDMTEEIENEIKSILPSGCFVFSQDDVSDNLSGILSDSFNYIGFICGFVVFVFLWLSLGSIEMSLIAFLPLTVSWIWILGIMDIFGMQFNIVNIILATFIFGQGDDYTIFIAEGLMYEYTTGKRRIEIYKNSVALSAVIMFIGIGALIFGKHPAMRSLAEVAMIGMITVVVMAYYIPPLIFRWMTRKGNNLREYPITLPRLAASLFSIMMFASGMFCFFLPYTLIYRWLLRRFWNGEVFYHRLLQRLSEFVIRTVPGVRFRCLNKTREDFSKPAIIVCNHQSHLDLMAILQLSHKIIVLTNEWAWNNPFYRAVIHTAEFYPVTNGYEKILPQLRNLVERGYSIVVFPEGTRSADGNIGRFHKGAFTLAKALEVDILPLYLHGCYDVLPKHDFMLRRGTITIEIGERFGSDKLREIDDRSLTRTIHRLYIEKYAEMRQELETPEYMAPYIAYKNKYKVNI